jgi:ParB-like chromosome segregation protein Spo0J
MEINFILPKVVNICDLYANDYNPNKMPKIEMDLLAECIKKYGFLFPIVTTFDASTNKYRIIDGEHRYETLKRLNSKEALIIDLQISIEDAIQLTVLMNRIKGMHKVESMSDLVVRLSSLGLSDVEIAKNLGMEAEEYIRLKQQLGIAVYFSKHEYSKSWEVKQ